MANSSPTLPVTFVTPTDAISLRITGPTTDHMIASAKAMKAVYIVLEGEQDPVSKLPTWEVFRVSHASKVPGGGTSLPLPSKTCISPTADGAVMWALHNR